jgi:hypothetical protein
MLGVLHAQHLPAHSLTAPRSLLILFVLLALHTSSPAGLCWSLLPLHIMIVLYFLFALIGAIILAAENDLCPAVEAVVTAQLSAKWQPVAHYYFQTTPLPAGVTSEAELKSVLTATGVVNMTDVDAQARSACVTSLSVWGSGDLNLTEMTSFQASHWTIFAS